MFADRQTNRSQYSAPLPGQSKNETRVLGEHLLLLRITPTAENMHSNIDVKHFYAFMSFPQNALTFVFILSRFSTSRDRSIDRTNHRAIAVMFVRLSVRPSVCPARACIVIIRYTFARI